MPRHADSDPVLVSYSSSRNISFRKDGDEIGYTWGEWRGMSVKAKNEALAEYLYELVDVTVLDAEEED